jgi:hypothetical protein
MAHLRYALQFGDHPMTFDIAGHRLRFVLEGLPFLGVGHVGRREYRGTGGGFSPTSAFLFNRSLSNRPAILMRSSTPAPKCREQL